MNKYLRFCGAILVTALWLLVLSGWVYTERNEKPAGDTPSNPSATLTPGSWLKYQVKRVKEETTGFKTVWNSELKVTVTGTEKIGSKKNAQTYYWLELVINEGRDYQKLFRFLINEAGQVQPEKLIIKRGVLNAVEMNLNVWSAQTGIPAEQILQETIGQFWFVPFPGQLAEPPANNPETISFNIKDKTESFKCLKYVTNRVLVNSTVKVWYTTQLPIPAMAKMLIIEDGYQTLFNLSDYGLQGGRSVLKEYPAMLNFKESK
jgi:hypothetical protein